MYKRKCYSHVCAVCGSEFESNQPRAKYCSEPCRVTGWAKKQEEWRKKQPKPIHKQRFYVMSELDEKNKRQKAKQSPVSLMDLWTEIRRNGSSLSYGQVQAQETAAMVKIVFPWEKEEA